MASVEEGWREKKKKHAQNSQLGSVDPFSEGPFVCLCVEWDWWAAEGEEE